MSFRYAACNEIFQKQSLAESCRVLAGLGYRGIELAPFTLSNDPASLDKEERFAIRTEIRQAGLEFVGLHWLLAAPPGLHATSPDPAVRNRTWEYVARLVDLCADLSDSAGGQKPVIVFGSPKQRSSTGGMTAQGATDAFTEGFIKTAPRAELRGVTLLVEALSPQQTDVVTSLAEAVEIVRKVNSPAVLTMFDVHNAIAEKASHVELIREFLPYIRHVHVNELDGAEPGRGDYDFAALLRCLANLRYDGWISLEAFDFSRDANDVVAGSINHLRKSEAPSARKSVTSA
jgi:sugar phosphate isomerase/epimerase